MTPPATTRKYSDVKVLRDVRCMSDGHYWFFVYGHGFSRTPYQPECGFDTEGYVWSTGLEAPKYLIAEVDRVIAEGCRNGYFTFYECDQDGNRRYDNLRYHDPERVAWYAEHLGK